MGLEILRPKIFYSISLGVITLHLLLIALFYLQYHPLSSSVKTRKNERVVVKTVRFSPKPVEAQSAVIRPQNEEKIIRPKEDPKPQKMEAKPKPKKTTPKAKPKAVEKKAPALSKKTESPVKPNPKRKELIAKAQESIAKITLPNGNITPHSTSLAVPELKAVKPQELSADEANYQDELASRLKMLLRLPEEGIVKIQLTIDRKGKFIKMAMISSSSKANAAYVELEIPKLSFPSFGLQFKSHEQYTFPITLKSQT